MAKSKNKQKHPVKGVVKVVLGIVLAAIIAFGGAFITGWSITGDPNPANWRKQELEKEPEEIKTSSEVVAISNTGRKMLVGNSYAMPRAMAFVGKPSTYSAAKEFNVMATLSNQYINAKFDWAVAFDNPASTWATGKVAEDYVQVIPASDGSATATVKYIAAFNEPITVTATLRGTDNSDTCTIDCLKNMEAHEAWTDTWEFGDPVHGGIVLNGTTGTVFADYRVWYMRFTLDVVFIETVQSYLNFDISMDDFDCTELFGDSVLAVEGSSNYSLELAIQVQRALSYADFIENFDAFDDEHKEAIYYAWYQAASDKGFVGNFEFGVEACVNGVGTEITAGWDIANHLYGELFGADAQPSVTLNTNIVF